MSLFSQEKLMQNQLQMQQLDAQRHRQAEQQTRSIQSNRSSTQDLLQRLRSTERQHNNTNDLSNPLFIQMPTHANPTETLAARFNSWRTIVGSLIHYLTEVVSVQEEVNRQNIRLQHAITFPFVTQGIDGELYQPMRVGGAGSGSTLGGNGAGIFSGHRNASSVVSTNNMAVGSPDIADLSQQNDEFELARQFFLPLASGSVQDLPTVLYQYHSTAALIAQNVVRELKSSAIPSLVNLKRDLLVKIKEIRSLQSDFRNNIDRYQHEVQDALDQFNRSVDTAKRSPSTLLPKNDPYLAKYGLDRQIKKLLRAENSLHEAFDNIQRSGKELEKVVYNEIQTALTVYAKLMGQQAQNVFDQLISRMYSGMLTKDPAFEWDSYIAKDTQNFIDMETPMRRLTDIRYKFQADPMTLQIRAGFLERKSKYLKSYARAWYVLTPCFIHEFKSPDRKKDPVPIMSLSLDSCQVAEHSRRDEHNPDSYHKFVLHAKQNGGLLRKGHNWVFRAESYDVMMQWYTDMKRLTQMPTPQARSTVAWERRRSNRFSSFGGSVTGSISVSRRSSTRSEGSTAAAAQAALLATSSAGAGGVRVGSSGAGVGSAGPVDQSSFRRIRSSPHRQVSPRRQSSQFVHHPRELSMTNQSMRTVLTLPQGQATQLSPPAHTEANDVVVSLPNERVQQKQVPLPKQAPLPKQSPAAPQTGDSQDSGDADDSETQGKPYKVRVDGSDISQEVGVLDISEDPKKETQM